MSTNQENNSNVKDFLDIDNLQGNTNGVGSTFGDVYGYIGIIAIVLTAIVSYNHYKAGKFSKDYIELEDDTKKQSRFKKWWNQSYIREIYRVRASQRKLICFIPWLGVWISLFFVWWFLSALITETLHPLQTMEKLKKYEGVIINYFFTENQMIFYK